ncbi:MAG: class 3 adenylate cyclase [Verrucomicrobiales bacterium]|jgi:class 3 adenylate cyclase
MSVNGGKGHFLQSLADIRKRADALVPMLKGNPAAKYVDKVTAAHGELVKFAFTELLDQGFTKDSADFDEETFQDTRHEIRNRLNHLYGPCQLLQRKIAGEKTAPAAAELRAAIQRSLYAIDSYGAAAGAMIQPLESGEGEIQARALPDTAKILLAEDEEQNREFLTEVLTSHGHDVSLAVDGEEALEKARAGDYDLVLLDLGLPKKSGFEVLSEMKASGDLAHTPVIVVTGRRGVEDAVRCLENGAEDFITKPVEIELLRARVNSCMEKKRLREREFAQHFPLALAREFARKPYLRDTAGKHAEVSVLFADIRQFSTISERLGPEKTLEWLRAVMEELSTCVIRHGGVLVDYAGDEILAMWGAPEEIKDHAQRACDAGLDMLRRIAKISDHWEPEINAKTAVGIGISSGKALVGNIGSTRRFKYGPLGNVVNVASRVQSATSRFRVNLMVTGKTRKLLGTDWGRGALRRLCRVRVKNIVTPIELNEVTAVSSARAKKLRDRYEQALTHFENGENQKASAILGDLLVKQPEDGPSLLLMSRVVNAMLNPQAEAETVWDLPSK